MPTPRVGEKPMTSAERQARRRERFNAMREALRRIRDEKLPPKEMRALAAIALQGVNERTAD